jgi:hypothetical protein
VVKNKPDQYVNTEALRSDNNHSSATSTSEKVIDPKPEEKTLGNYLSKITLKPAHLRSQIDRISGKLSSKTETVVDSKKTENEDLFQSSQAVTAAGA